MTSLANSTGGQDHDRSEDGQSITLPNMPPTSIDGPGKPVEITAVQKMLSATSGSLLTGLLVTPLDVVRVRLQSQGVPRPATSDFAKYALTAPSTFRPSDLGVTACCREVFFMNNNAEYCVVGPRVGGATGGAATAPVECAVEQTQQRAFTSTLDGLRKIARNEGFTTLWRGLSPTLIMAIPANIIYFTGYEWLRFDQRSPIQQSFRDDHAALAAGSTARILAATAVSPVELFRTRLQASRGSSAAGHLADTFQGIREMTSTHGYRSLWRGLNLTFWRDVPFSGLYWWGYETIRGKLTDVREQRRGRTLELEGAAGMRPRARRRSQSRENHVDTFVDSFTAGAVSGMFASIVTMPFDVGKTRTQVFRDSGRVATGGAGKAALAPEEQSMVRLLWHIFQTEGISGLWRGWIPRTLKVAPACAIMISSYEVGKRSFRGVNERAARREMGGPEQAET